MSLTASRSLYSASKMTVLAKAKAEKDIFKQMSFLVIRQTLLAKLFVNLGPNDFCFSAKKGSRGELLILAHISV